MSNEEIEHLFKYVTKSLRTIGVTMSVNRLTEKVYNAVDALLIEKARDALQKSMRSFHENFQRHSSKKNNFLDYPELENLLLECSLVLKPSMLDRLYKLLDPGKKLSKIAYNSLKFLVSGDVSERAVSNSFA